MRLILVSKVGELLDALSPLIIVFGGDTPLREIPPIRSN